MDLEAKKQEKQKADKLHEHFADNAIRNEYKRLVTAKLSEIDTEQNPSNQELWDKTVNILQSAAEETIGSKQQLKRSNNEDIKYLSKLQRSINAQVLASNDENTKEMLKRYRNKIMTEIHKQLQHEENLRIQNNLKELERIPHSNERMFQAVKELQRMKPSQPLLVNDGEGLTAEPEQQTKIIAEYFKGTFFKNAEQMPEIPPTAMTTPFTSNEIKKAVSRMKSNKSPGCDEIQVELIKNAPDIILETIAHIYNKLAETGDCPKEINFGILRPLQKPGKTKGPLPHLRPIILLSTLRKILAACIMMRIKDRLELEIPATQAAYRKGRSTTEHVFACKQVIERTISAKNETVHLILLDRAKRSIQSTERS